MKTFRPKNHTEKHQHRANCDVDNYAMKVMKTKEINSKHSTREWLK